MENENVFTLINQQNGNLAFKFYYFEDARTFDHLQHNNFYSVVWVKQGGGLLKVDYSEYLFEGGNLFAFSPYQPFMISTDQKIRGIVIQFHPDFYCIHKIVQETNCDKLVFNNIYQEPYVIVDPKTAQKLDLIIEQLKAEFDDQEIIEHKLLIPNLIIFLVTISRLKAQAKNMVTEFTDTKVPFMLRNLKTVIESNYKKKHSASDYAELLNISPNALAKLVKMHFNKTLTDLITERIIIEAKRELYLTDKSIKEIAWLLGYTDEFYFSRFFKVNTDISPQMYRDTVGFAKAN